MVHFICKDYLELIGMRVERELQNENSLPNVGFEPRTFRLRSESATDVSRVDKSSLGFTCATFRNLPAAHCRCSTIIFHELHLLNSLQKAKFLIGQTEKRYKYYMTKIHNRLFCYIYHMLQVNFSQKIFHFMILEAIMEHPLYYIVCKFKTAYQYIIDVFPLRFEWLTIL